MNCRSFPKNKKGEYSKNHQEWDNTPHPDPVHLEDTKSESESIISVIFGSCIGVIDAASIIGVVEAASIFFTRTGPTGGDPRSKRRSESASSPNKATSKSRRSVSPPIRKSREVSEIPEFLEGNNNSLLREETKEEEEYEEEEEDNGIMELNSIRDDVSSLSSSILDDMARQRLFSSRDEIFRRTMKSSPHRRKDELLYAPPASVRKNIPQHWYEDNTPYKSAPLSGMLVTSPTAQMTFSTDGDENSVSSLESGCSFRKLSPGCAFVGGY